MSRRARELWAEMTAEKGKAGVLGGLLLVLAVVGVRALVKSSDGPAHAAASTQTQPAPQAHDASRTPSTAVISNAAEPGSSAASSARAQPDLTPPRRYSSGVKPARDIFALSEEHFPVVTPVADGTRDANRPKSADGVADNTGEADTRDAAHQANADAANLRVRSIALGPRTLAIIEDTTAESASRRTKVVRAGDTVAGFLVTAVTAHGVTLSRDGVTIDLKPQRSAGTRP